MTVSGSVHMSASTVQTLITSASSTEAVDSVQLLGDKALEPEETAQTTYCDNSTDQESPPVSHHPVSPFTTSVRQKKSQSPNSFASTTEAVCCTQTLDLESVPTLYPSVSQPACLAKMRSSSSARKVTHLSTTCSLTSTAAVQSTQILELESPAASIYSVTLPVVTSLPQNQKLSASVAVSSISCRLVEYSDSSMMSESLDDHRFVSIVLSVGGCFVFTNVS